MSQCIMGKKMNIIFTSKDNPKISELNIILDKIFTKNDLSEREINFLDNFDKIQTVEFKDYNFLTLSDLFYLINKIDKIIILDIKDREGRINQQILELEYDFDDCKIYLKLKHGNYTLTDNFLYRLVYEFKHDNYSLDVESEYYEKIIINE